MGTIEDKIKEIEEEIRKTQYNKHTEYHIGKLRAKIAELRAKQIKISKKGSGGSGFDIKKSGNATVALLGFPSVGKSTLLNKLTNADSKIAHYAFTTLSVVPGTLTYKGANIQILDLPGVISGASEGRGRGREVLGVVRNSDLILMVLDPFHLNHYEVLKKELYNVGIRINKKPPRVTITKKDKGGITLNSTVKLTKITLNVVRGILNSFGIFNADVLCHDDVDDEEFVDAVIGNRRYIDALIIINKIDLCKDMENLKKESKKLFGDTKVVFVSAEENIGIENLKDEIFNALNFIKIYTKPIHEDVDKEPMIVKRGTSVKEVCRTLHKDILKNFRYALVYGKSVKFNGQRVGLNHIMEDGDIITIVTERQ